MKSASIALYRSLLFVLPSSLRRDHGEDMVHLFSELHDDVRKDRGAIASLRFTLGSVVRLTLAGMASHLGRLGIGGPTPSPTDPRFRESMMYGIFRDARFGIRTLIKSPGYVAVVVVTLALAIGVNTSIFSIVRMLLAPPIGFSDQDSLVVAFSRNTEVGRARAAVSYPDLIDLSAGSRSLDEAAGRTSRTVTLTGAEEPVRVAGNRVTTNYFPLLGVEPVLGRLFLEEEGVEGNDRVALLGHGAWTRLFGADPGILGSPVSIDRIEHTVIGILPASLDVASPVAVYRPMTATATTDRAQRNLWVVGRLAPGATVEQAHAELQDLSLALQREHPDTNSSWELYAVSFHEAMVGPNAAVVFTLMTVAVGFVLLIGCANVASLTLARARQRSRELSLRAALGAGRGSLVRTLLIESLILALLAGGAGLLVTRWIFAGLRAIGNGQMTLFEALRVDPGVLLFTLGLSLATPLLFGLWPALRACREDLNLALREGGAAGDGRDVQRARRTMVIAQVAMAVTLLIVAGLATRTMVALLSVELGFDPDRLLSLRLTLDENLVAPDGSRFTAVRDELEALPGVVNVGLISARPIVAAPPSRSLWIDGDQLESGETRGVEVLSADPGLFETLELTTVRGRVFDETDSAESLPVAVIGKAAAERYWPERSPIDERIRIGEGSETWHRIVGVVSDLRSFDADQPPPPRVYLPFSQTRPARAGFLIRTAGDPGDLAAAARQAVWRVDPQQPVEDVRTMTQIRRDDLAGDLAIIGLLAGFALVAFVLSVAGVYGIVTYSVSQRTREIGIRMAVGADAGQVSRLITRQGVTMVVVGALLGVGAGFLLSRLMTGMLYGISSLDPLTFLGVPAALILVGMLAAAIPARRATRLDPALTLRSD